jgi:hypothetical protein
VRTERGERGGACAVYTQLAPGLESLSVVTDATCLVIVLVSK